MEMGGGYVTRRGSNNVILPTQSIDFACLCLLYFLVCRRRVGFVTSLYAQFSLINYKKVKIMVGEKGKKVNSEERKERGKTNPKYREYREGMKLWLR
jgi:hypothetical protein